jgi:C-terminal processing protease CtpA/Prc
MLIVQFNDSPVDSTIRPGMEFLQINGRPVAEIVRVLLPKVSRDGFIETGRRKRIARTFPSLLWLYVDQKDTYTVTARDIAGRTITSTIPGIFERDRSTIVNPVNATMSANVARLDGPAENVVLEFLEYGGVARIRIRSFGGQGFLSTLDSSFAEVRANGTKSLILDLRGNGGGVDEYGAALVSHFVAKPFHYFDYIHLTTIGPSFATWPARTFEAMREGTQPHAGGGFRVTPKLHPGVAEQQPARSPFLGKLVVLIDGGSFSTTADVAAQLRSLGRATFVGEETAGAYEGNTSGLNALIILPNSRLRLKVMMYGYWNAVKPPAARGRGTLPDYVVTRSVSDILRGRDPQLERAIALAR